MIVNINISNLERSALRSISESVESESIEVFDGFITSSFGDIEVTAEEEEAFTAMQGLAL